MHLLIKNVLKRVAKAIQLNQTLLNACELRSQQAEMQEIFTMRCMSLFNQYFQS